MIQFSESEIAELKALFPEVSRFDEGDLPYFLIPNLAFPEGIKPRACDVLLCPVQRDGYPSRLFFAARLESVKAASWNPNSTRILERNWYVYSWKLTQANLRLAHLVGLHLRALV